MSQEKRRPFYKKPGGKIPPVIRIWRFPVSQQKKSASTKKTIPISVQNQVLLLFLLNYYQIFLRLLAMTNPPNPPRTTPAAAAKTIYPPLTTVPVWLASTA